MKDMLQAAPPGPPCRRLPRTTTSTTSTTSTTTTKAARARAAEAPRTTTAHAVQPVMLCRGAVRTGAFPASEDDHGPPECVRRGAPAAASAQQAGGPARTSRKGGFVREQRSEGTAAARCGAGAADDTSGVSAHTAGMSTEQRAAAALLRGVLAEVEAGRLSASSSQARRLLRRLEGALLVLELEPGDSGTGEP